MLVTFFTTALMMGLVTSRLRRQKEIEKRQRIRTEALYALTRALAVSTDLNQAMRLGTEQINALCKSRSAVVMFNGAAEPVFDQLLGDQIELTEEQKGLVHWTIGNKKAAGRFSDTLPQQALMYLPLMSSGNVRAVLLIELSQESRLDLAQRTLLESFTALMTLMLEKDSLLRISHEARMKEDTQNLQSALLDNLSHELKTPLTIIAGYLDALLLYHEWPKDAMDLLEESRLASMRLTNSVDAVLDLTKLDTGNFRPSYAWCEVGDIVNEAVKQAAVGVSKDRVRIEYPDVPLYVQADFYMLTQALKNIVSNALIHGPVRGVVDVKASVLNQKILINVVDQGGGIPQETLSRIFDKFYRGAQTRKGGLGLGLSIARRFVEMNNGTVGAINLLPQGFMVSMVLPVVEKEGGA
jgi:two-component system sensor histidine kinase KdpD